MAAPRIENRNRDDASSCPSTSEHQDADEEFEPAPIDNPPTHPIASMQGAFEESIVESNDQVSSQDDKLDSKARRRKLLEEDDYNGSCNARWRRKPDAKFHPLWKLVAQISFGLHLLHQQLAKSDEEVVKILQTHVDEVDGFLEKTTEDFDLALADIKERINYLRLPLEHVNIFDVMLDDKPFRTSIIEGNEKIERIVDRTARAMSDSLVDVNKGIDATLELVRYLDNIGDDWTAGNEELSGVYTAMRGNSEGWYRCFQKLQKKGHSLGVALAQLSSILNEMSKRAGVASRRSVLGTRATDVDRTPPRVLSPPPTSRYSQPSSPSKPLPQAPNPIAPVIQASLARHQLPSCDRRFEEPRRQLKPPKPQQSSVRQPWSDADPHHVLASRKPAESTRIAGPKVPQPSCPRTAGPPDSNQPAPQHSRDRGGSPSFPDSAYSSGSSGSDKNHFGPTFPDMRPTQNLALFPPTAPHTPSVRSMRSDLLPTASPLSCPAPVVASRRPSSSSSGPRKSPSLSALKRLFQRKSSSKSTRSTLAGLDESHEPS